MWLPNDFGCQLAVNAAEKLADGQLTEEERNAAITATQRGFAEASNAWSYLVAASAACLHPIGIDAVDIAIENMDSYNMELFNRSYHVRWVALVRDVFGNPFRPVSVDPTWRTSTVLALASQMYESRDFSPMPILADAIQDAGCDNEDILNHCRQPGEHVRGCWVVDLILEKS
jgi:hypothetical protein